MHQLELRFPEDRFRRKNPADVRDALKGLLLPQSPLLSDFFARFCGPIGSDVTGFLLLDALEGAPTIVSATELMRSRYTLGRNWAVLTDIVGDGMLMYDAATDRVFSVDFEGGLELMKKDKLEATHDSLQAFFCWFFELEMD